MNIKQQIILSGTGGQGILFLTRFFSEAALEKGLAVLTSETHGMAMRGATVVSHVKVGPYTSPVIPWGRADVALIMNSENLPLHEGFVRPGGILFVNTMLPNNEFGIDASGIAARHGTPAMTNMALLGFAVASRQLFCNKEISLQVIKRISSPSHRKLNEEIFLSGFIVGSAKITGTSAGEA